eukprot:g74997.t1
MEATDIQESSGGVLPGGQGGENDNAKNNKDKESVRDHMFANDDLDCGDDTDFEEGGFVWGKKEAHGERGQKNQKGKAEKLQMGGDFFFGTNDQLQDRTVLRTPLFDLNDSTSDFPSSSACTKRKKLDNDSSSTHQQTKARTRSRQFDSRRSSRSALIQSKPTASKHTSFGSVVRAPAAATFKDTPISQPALRASRPKFEPPKQTAQKANGGGLLGSDVTEEISSHSGDGPVLCAGDYEKKVKDAEQKLHAIRAHFQDMLQAHKERMEEMFSACSDEVFKKLDRYEETWDTAFKQIRETAASNDLLRMDIYQLKNAAVGLENMSQIELIAALPVSRMISATRKLKRPAQSSFKLQYIMTPTAVRRATAESDCTVRNKWPQARRDWPVSESPPSGKLVPPPLSSLASWLTSTPPWSLVLSLEVLNQVLDDTTVQGFNSSQLFQITVTLSSDPSSFSRAPAGPHLSVFFLVRYY